MRKVIFVTINAAGGKRPWRFYHKDRQGSFKRSGTNPFAGVYSAMVTISAPGQNVQLQQPCIELRRYTLYELSFTAYSSDGRDMSVFLHKHTEPFTNYGLRRQRVRLEPYWKHFTIRFITPDLLDMNDARLRFWFASFAEAGTVYHIDRVMLRPVYGS